VDNDKGVVGIAPRTSISVMSPTDLHPYPFIPPMQHLWDRVGNAASRLGIGDVLLIEQQTQDDHLPVETDFLVFKAIQAAVMKGIVVVECAGNGATDLDNHSFFGDSGATIVGGCDSQSPHRRSRGAHGSNYGSRVDCCAWADSVFTTGHRDQSIPVTGELPNYFHFSGTSSAGAIVAGVCLLIQQMHRAAHGGFPMPALALRDILRDPANGTLAGNTSSERIGAMPDLAKIIANLSL
jgi:hypothetical protein